MTMTMPAFSNWPPTARPVLRLSTRTLESVGPLVIQLSLRPSSSQTVAVPSHRTEFITVAGNQGDRNNLTLWHDGDTLIQTVAGSCENTIVVMHTVGQVIMEPWIDLPNVKAVVWAGLPGQESGNAITDVLFGMVNPSGRLPFTMARQRSDYGADVIGYDLPEDTTQLDVPYSDGLMVDCKRLKQRISRLSETAAS